MYSYSDYKGRLSESEFEIANNLINAVKSRGYSLSYYYKSSVSCDDIDNLEILNMLGHPAEFFSVSDPDGVAFCHISLEVTGRNDSELISSVTAPKGINSSYWDVIDMIVVDSEGYMSPNKSRDYGD